MRIVTWNAQHGGGKRAPHFAERLAEFEADVVVITEFRNNQCGSRIATILRDSGITHFATHDAPPRLNSVAIGARLRFDFATLDTLGAEGHRCLRANIGGVSLFGLYFPQKEEKVPIFEALLNLDRGVPASESILVGDFNTGRHWLDEAGKTFHAAEYFERLEEVGWIDAWRSRNPSKSEFSWYSNAGNGFRLDHAFVGKPLDRRIQQIAYDHSVRESGLSDHSALVIDVDDF